MIVDSATNSGHDWNAGGWIRAARDIRLDLAIKDSEASLICYAAATIYSGIIFYKCIR